MKNNLILAAGRRLAAKGNKTAAKILAQPGTSDGTKAGKLAGACSAELRAEMAIKARAAERRAKLAKARAEALSRPAAAKPAKAAAPEPAPASKTPHLDKFQSLPPAQASRYYRENKAAIAAEQIDAANA